MSWNQIMIDGNLGKDVETKYTPGGLTVSNFSLATTKKNKDKEKEVTTWFRVTCFGALAELAAKYLEKGKEVIVQGELSTQEWTDKEGRQRYSLEVTADKLRFVGRKGDSNNSDSEDDEQPKQSNKKSASASKSSQKNNVHSFNNTSNKKNSSATDYAEDQYNEEFTEDDIPF